MRLKLDENLSEREARLLRQSGHDVETVSGQNLCGASDHDVARVCASEGRCLVTLNLDFANPLTFPPREHHGIAVLRFPDRGGPEDMREAVRTLDAGLARDSINGELWVVQRGRIRVYKPEEPDPSDTNAG